MTFDWSKYESKEQPKPIFDWSKYEQPSAQQKLDQLNEMEEPLYAEERANVENAARTVSQAASGIGQALALPLDLVSFMGHGEALADLDEVEEAARKEGVPFDRQKYLEALQASQRFFPTYTNIERGVESATGLPLTPKNKLQKLIRLGSMAATLSPGGLLSKGTAAVTAPVISGTAQGLGAPEGIADVAGLLGSNLPLMGVRAAQAAIPSRQAGALEQSLVGQGLPTTQYPTSQKALTKLQAPEIAASEGAIAEAAAKPPAKPSGPQVPKLPKVNISLAPRKITPGEEALGLEVVAPQTQAMNPIDAHINEMFPMQFKNTTQGGAALTNEIRRVDQQVYRAVNELYKKSRELNEGIETIHPQLASQISDRIESLKKIPELSGPQKQMLTALESIENALVEKVEGQVTGYKPISNQTLLDQNQSLRQKIDYDFAHGDAKNIFKPLIAEIDNSVISTAEDMGNLEAAYANVRAREAYKDWTQTFDNDYVNRFRDISNKDFSGNYQKAINLDDANVIRNILDTNPRGQILLKGLEHSVYEKNLGKFFEEPRKYTPKEFNKAADESMAVLGPERTDALRASFKQAQKQPFRATHKKPEKPKELPEVKIAGKYLNKQPEDISNMLNSVTDIKQLREDLTKVKHPEIFETLSKQKMRSILRGGKIEKNFTGDDLYQFLNNEHNYELFAEFIGPEATEAARLAAKEVGKKQMRLDTVKKFSNKAFVVKFLTGIHGLL